MRIDILTLFPGLFDAFLKESLLGKALQKKLFEIYLHDIRRFSADKHRSVDDTPYGGGAGMVLQVEPLYRCLHAIRPAGPSGTQHFASDPTKQGLILLLTPEGEVLQQRHVPRLAQLDQLTLICGRYEGFDERITTFIDGKLSIGQYVLSGGELAAQVVTEALSRYIPGVLGAHESAANDSFSMGTRAIEAPQYTKPATFTTPTSGELSVPDILLTGHHANIEQWRASNPKQRMPFSQYLTDFIA